MAQKPSAARTPRAALLLLLLATACAPVASDPLTPDAPLPPQEGCLGPAGEPEPGPLPDEAEQRGLTPGPPAHNRGVAAADFDGDGRTDLLLTNSYDGSALFLQREDGTFRAFPAPSTGYDSTASAVDYDGDGDVDLWLGCGGFLDFCADRLLRNDGPGGPDGVHWTDVSLQAGIAGTARATFGVAWADYDGDGDPDAHVAAKRPTDEDDVFLPGPTEDLLWRNEGDGRFTEVAEAAGLADPGDHHQAAWIDFDGDGDPDLFVPTLDGPNALFRNEAGRFVEVADRAVQAPRLAFAALAEDFDGDGITDLFAAGMAAHEGEHHHLFLSDGAGALRDVTEAVGLADLPMRTMGLQAGDLDRDGLLEIAFGNGNPDAGDRNGLLTLLPTAQGLEVLDRSGWIDLPSPTGAAPYPYRSHGMAFITLADGESALFVGNGGAWPDQAEPDQLFVMPPELTGRSLRVRVVDADGRPAGLGAAVTVSADRPGSTWGVSRRVGRSSGFNSSRPHTLDFGLGRCEGPYRVDVVPPWGGDPVVVEHVDPDALDDGRLDVSL